MTSTLALGIDSLLDQQVSVIGLSLGPMQYEIPSDDPIALAVRRALHRGTSVICAAGNWGPGPDTLQALARIAGVVSVGAVDRDGGLLESSSRGIEGRTGPTLCADGNAGLLPGRETPAAGTSFAAAKVVGMAAALHAMLDSLRLDFHDLAAGRDWSWTSDQARPRIGFADTGVDAQAIAARPTSAAEALWQGGPTIRWYRGDDAGRWCEGMQRGLAALGVSCRLAVEPPAVTRALVSACMPMPGTAVSASGAGLIDDEACVAWLGSFTARRFVDTFAARPLSADQARGVDALSRELEGRWRSDEANTLYRAFRAGSRFAMARVI